MNPWAIPYVTLLLLDLNPLTKVYCNNYLLGKTSKFPHTNHIQTAKGPL